MNGPASQAEESPGRHRDAWLEIDLAAIAHNVAALRTTLKPGVAVAPVVKANAYGHGLAAVAGSLDGQADALCVATLDEALELRRAGIRGPVVILYPIPATGLPEAVRARLELTVMDEGDARALAVAMARLSGKLEGQETPRVGVHVAVDTGMARGGLPPERVETAARALLAVPGVSLAGLWTHLVSPGDVTRSRAQVDDFERAARFLANAGADVPPRHICASGGIFAGTAPDLEMVRPGLVVYGVSDADLPIAPHRAAAAAALRPAMSLKARAVAFTDVPVGGTVGYGGRWQAARASRVAILPLGYADGFARQSEPGSEALIRDRRAPLVGVISMDALAVDVTDLPGVDGRDEFVLLGQTGDERITAVDLARTRNTIPWDVLSGMAARLARVYYPPAGIGEPDTNPGLP
ncbi:alanine racemase [soil metagenome]